MSIYLAAHPIHLTVTNIECGQKKKLFVSTRLFLDDFETILELKNNEQLNFGKSDENPNANKFVKAYFAENLTITINGKIVKSKKYKLKSIKFEGSGTSTVIWLYFEIPFKHKIREISITNKLMTDLYFDQKNLLIFTCQNEQHALEFSNAITEKNLKF